MIYCISDIHGEYELFCRLLDKVRFGGGDTLFVLGDMIDKGTQSLRLARAVLSMPDAAVIAGNHEYDLVKIYRARADEYGDAEAAADTLRAYFPGEEKLMDVGLAERLAALPYFLRTKDMLCVHAGVPLSADGGILPPERASREQLVYDRVFKEPSVRPKDSPCVVFGHTPTRYIGGRDGVLLYPRSSAPPRSARDLVKAHIDTGVTLGGVLGIFRADDCRAFYVHL